MDDEGMTCKTCKDWMIIIYNNCGYDPINYCPFCGSEKGFILDEEIND